MFRFITNNLIPKHNHSIKLVSFLKTLALNPNSNTSISENEDNPTVSYLITKCGLPLHSAISASKQVTIKSTQEANSVLQLFKTYGFSQAQITNLISKSPSLIQSDPAKTLKPKFEFFKSVGLLKPELAKILSSNPYFLPRSSPNLVIPTVKFLKTIKTDEDLIRTLNQWPLIWYHNYHSEIKSNLLTLRAQGVSCLDIYKMLVKYPRVFTVGNEVFQGRVRRFEKLGIGSDPLPYLRFFRIMLSVSDSHWEKKVNLFKSFGWSDSDVLEAFKRDSHLMALSEKKITTMMDFYLNKLGLKSSDVARRPKLLGFSLEKRIIPRCSVIQVLLSRDLIKNDLSIISALVITKTSFDEKFVTKYQRIVPEIVGVYQGKKGYPRFEGMDLMP